MGKDLFVCMAKKGFAFEVAVAKESIMQAATVADIIPFALGAIAF